MYVMTLDIADGVVQTVAVDHQPRKLRHLGPLADVRALMREQKRHGRDVTEGGAALF